jgi:hypothetical protein
MKRYLGVAVALAIVLVAGTLASAQQLQSVQVEKVVAAHIQLPVSVRLPQSPILGNKQVPGIRLAQNCSAQCGVTCAIRESCFDSRGRYLCACDCCARCLRIRQCL